MTMALSRFITLTTTVRLRSKTWTYQNGGLLIAVLRRLPGNDCAT
jgi:hypothetical protein